MEMTVSELPKTDAGYREIILPPSAGWTISKILELNPDGEFLFMDKGKRIRENTYNKRLNRICDKLNLPHRTTHKIRKTYGTTLLDSDVNDSFVAEQMGHTDVSTTRNYIITVIKATRQSLIRLVERLISSKGTQRNKNLISVEVWECSKIKACGDF